MKGEGVEANMVIIFHQDRHLKESEGLKKLLENFATEIVDQIILLILRKEGS